MNTYLLEIGVEELPYRFIPNAIKQLKQQFEKMLNENKLKFSEVKTYGTPRRLVVFIDGLEEKQPDISKEVKGPIANIAYDADGNLTQAALGFARKNNIEPSALYKKDNYVWAKIEEKGKSTIEVLKNNIPNAVLSLQGPYFMRWANLEIKFQRPIRWIVSLFGKEELPVEIATVKSGKISRGHRFSNMSVEINSPEEYIEKMYSANVIVDSEKRKQIIVETATKKAQEIGAEVEINPNLLDEVIYLTEWPVPILCDFSEDYLKIPDEVTVTVMATHQRYFPIYKNGKLLNNFITMANYVGDAYNNIKSGNEKVIKARLDDAKFFFHEDTKIKLEDYFEKLKGVTFQKGMGSVYDKTNRIIKLSQIICDELQIDNADILRTAKLCKCDLVTSLVFEFTELQGFIGADYAKISGEKDNVSQGIKEHYYPLNAESEIAQGLEGAIVGVADKLDTIVAVFASGKKPTGSADPLGVRRATLGILKTIIQKNNINIDLMKLIKQSIDLLPVNIDNKEKLFADIVEFFEQRLIILLSDKYKNDVLEACVSNTSALSDLNDFMNRINLVSDFTQKPSYDKLHESINRIIKLIKTSDDQNVNEGLFAQDEEKALYHYFKDVNENAIEYNQLIDILINSNEVIANFFDKVLVMDKEEKIKQNRINLLTLVKTKFNRIANFSKIIH